MSRRVVPLVVFLACLLAVPAGAEAGTFSPGAPGAGDPYYPLDGNGGYDVAHYGLDVRYTPRTDVLAGVATIRARATQNLSRFNLDLDGLTVREITVDGRRAKWTRANGELTVTPPRGLRRGLPFTTVVRYDGVPKPVPGDPLGGGFMHTDDGTVVVGEPHVASTWFPVNDHPTDKASYTFRVTVPAGLEAVANGALVGQSTRKGWTTWTWMAREPMASYLATATIGEFDLRTYRRNGITFWDAVDPDLYTPKPRTGKQYAISQLATPAYKRLTRTIHVPAGGGKLSFWLSGQGLAFVEARPVGTERWTTLPDLNGHTTSEDAGFCEFYLEYHPFLKHYFSVDDEGVCTPKGSSGRWNYWFGQQARYAQWAVDLSAYEQKAVEVSITLVKDEFDTGRPGLLLDDVVVPGGAGTTSFEPDASPMDGWRATSAPAGSPKNENNWIAGPRAKAPDAAGEVFQRSFARQSEILSFLASKFGPYPFRVGGGIVDDQRFGFSLENQTRPIYSARAGDEPGAPDGLLAHELAHQWFGDDVSLRQWKDIWLNEGFASYATWMWDAREGVASEEESFRQAYGFADGDAEFWKLPMTDPGPDSLFAWPIYQRGAMVVHRLRVAVGDATFFRILRTWTRSHAGGDVTTADFVALSERLAGRDLSAAVWDPWLFGLKQPPLPGGATSVPERGRLGPPGLPGLPGLPCRVSQREAWQPPWSKQRECSAR